MRYITKYLLYFLVISFYACLLISSTVLAENSETKTENTLANKIYYTSVNIWYESPDKIPSTNYHKGPKLPIGTKVKIISVGNRKIQFVPVDTSLTFTIVQQRKHCIIKLKELFDRYFSEKDILGQEGYLHNLTEKEKECVNNGTISHGMSKVAVLMAYGYPPSHKTPLLSSDVWHYWHSRFEMVDVHFKNDKVYKIERIEPVLPGMKRKKVESVSGDV
ncbi:MAG: hypothetical protein KJ550_04670 [Proteobacteria bacterium]|nr:hypothetical protein [Desulfobacteraceae bacterium]MBU4012741.1 hypothetical protein [Pseudomonadota bacterium]MBU4127829.1 hypothetical protein [Pseudomonadota bacterium]MCG2757835.1 hypothetical protein [Desulfobacteraceae bacterium]